ncbi:MAG: helical backbone metal receptor [Ignavibacteria bacterium]
MEVSFDNFPKRIISLAPNITEALYAIGADTLIAGVTDFCDFPSEAKSKVKTGSYLSPDYEVMTSLRPDLIIMNVESISQPTYQALKNLNTKIFVSNAKDIDGIIKMMNDLGRITGMEINAKEVTDNILKQRQIYIDLNKNAEKKKSLIIISVSPLMTSNGNTFINEVAELSGFENIYKDEFIDYPLISYEDITAKDPAYIILPTDTTNANNYTRYINELSDKLNTTTAIKNNRIILIDENIIFRPGPRVLESVRLLRFKLK